MILKQDTYLKDKRYRIIKEIGKGGFAITYMAEELYFYKWEDGLKQNKITYHTKPEVVVIKELFYKKFCSRSDDNRINTPNEKADDWDNLKKRMTYEGNIINKFDHPNIIKVRNIFEENNTIYTVMNYVDGEDLEKMIEKKGSEENPNPIPLQKAIQYIKQALYAIKEVHKHKMYHFDIKPSNLLIDRYKDQVILIDFGAALSYNKDGAVEYAGNAINKIRKTQGASIPFCPIEIENRKFDFANIDEAKHKPASIDLYSVGATLYYCLTATEPPSAMQLSNHTKTITLPDNFNTPMGIHYLNIIKKAMAINPINRFVDADTFISAIDDVEYFIKYPLPPQEKQEIIDPATPTKKKTNKTITYITIAAVVVIGIILATLFLYNTSNTPKDDVVLMLTNADKLYDNNNIGAAISIYRDYEENLNDKQLVRLAGELLKGNEPQKIPKDIAKAYNLYRKALDKGNVDAEAVVGVFYLDGAPTIGIEQNYESAFNYLHHATEHGNNNNAVYKLLADMYYTGEGTPKNIDNAIKYYKLAKAEDILNKIQEEYPEKFD